MKVFIVAAMILSVCMIAGCGGDDDDDDLVGPGGVGGVGGYSAFPPQAGSWSEYSGVSLGERFRMESIGTDTLEGRQCFVIEYESMDQGQKIVMQIWMATAAEAAFLFVKQDGQVLRMDMTGFNDVVDMVAQDEPEEAVKIGEGNYTTPTGKTVGTIEYTSRDPITGTTVEFSVSGEVPFSQVQTKQNGVIEMSLYDFGASGAFRDITKQEAENAQPMFPGGLPGGIPDGGFPDMPPEIPGGGQPDEPVIPGNPVDPGVPDAGDDGIVITVGPGARPTIQVSQPVSNLIVLHGFVPIWMFESEVPFGQGPGLPGPFQYGIVPAGAKSNMINPPDLIAGQAYTIQVMGMQGLLPFVDMLEFTR